MDCVDAHTQLLHMGPMDVQLKNGVIQAFLEAR